MRLERLTRGALVHHNSSAFGWLAKKVLPQACQSAPLKHLA